MSSRDPPTCLCCHLSNTVPIIACHHTWLFMVVLGLPGQIIMFVCKYWYSPASTFNLYLSRVLLYTPAKATQISNVDPSSETSLLSPVSLYPRLTQMEFGIQSPAMSAAGKNLFCHPLRGTFSLYLSLRVDMHHLLPLVVFASHTSFPASRNLVLFFITPIGQAVSKTEELAHLSGVSPSPSPLLNDISNLYIISIPIANTSVLACYFLSSLCYCLLISWLTHL